MKYFDEFKNLFNSTFDAIRGNVFLEVLFIAALSVSASQIDKWDSPWLLVIILSIIVLVKTYLTKLKFLNNFPNSLVDQIKLDTEKKDLELEIQKFKTEKERITIINSSISDTISGLNDHTCTLSSKSEDMAEIAEKLCDSDVKEGLIKILNPLLNAINSIVQSHTVKTTIGVYFEDLAQETSGDPSIPPAIPYLSIIKDENDLEPIIPTDLVNNKSISGDIQNVQHVIELSTRNKRFTSEIHPINGNDYSVNSSPIPLACNENYTSGALLLILSGTESPKDLNTIMELFSKILTNWIYKYNSCVYSRRANSEVGIWQTINFEDGAKVLLYHNDKYKFIEKEESQPVIE